MNRRTVLAALLSLPAMLFGGKAMLFGGKRSASSWASVLPPLRKNKKHHRDIGRRVDRYFRWNPLPCPGNARRTRYELYTEPEMGWPAVCLRAELKDTTPAMEMRCAVIFVPRPPAPFQMAIEKDLEFAVEDWLSGIGSRVNLGG